MKEFLKDFIDKNSEPVIIVGIRWGFNAPLFFSTKNTKVNGNQQPLVTIITVGTYTNAKQQDNVGATASMSITIKDVEGQAKKMLDLFRTEKAGATIYLGFEASGKSIPLVSGEVIAPITWNEGDRTISLEIATVIESQQVGFSPTREDFFDLAPSAEGQAWPVIFGKCANVPCPKIRQKITGFLKTDIRLYSEVTQGTPTAFTFQRDGKGVKVFAADLNNEVAGRIYVEGGWTFPQGKRVKIIISGVIFEGTFNGDFFNVTTPNYPRVENVSFASRQSGADNQNYKVAWLNPQDVRSGVNIQGCHIYLKTTANKAWYNYCVKQEGTKCHFKYPWADTMNGTPSSRGLLLVTSSQTIERAYACSESGLSSVDLDGMYFKYNSSNSKPQAYQMAQTLKNAPGAFWIGSAGEKVKLYDVNDPDIYICSAVELSSIDAVYGVKRVRTTTGQEKKVFAPIPNTYYTKQLVSNYNINGQRASALLFFDSLTDKVEEGWEDQIYVTGTSTVGPNPADIIWWLITNYTNLTPDGSFDHVASILGSPKNYRLTYPGDDAPEEPRSDFALTSTQDAMSLAKQIAWQCKCALRVDSNIVQLIYLNEIQPITILFDEGNTEKDSLELSFTDTTEIKTHLICRWRESLRYQRSLISKNHVKSLMGSIADEESRDEHTVIYKNNIQLYGDVKDDFEFFAYNQEKFVRDSSDYWGLVLSNSWRKAKLRCFHIGVPLQPFDMVFLTYDWPVLANINALIAVVESVSYDFSSKSCTLELWLASEAGTFANDTRLWT
jgi:hypothetical protein